MSMSSTEKTVKDIRRNTRTMTRRKVHNLAISRLDWRSNGQKSVS